MYYTTCPHCGAHLDPGERCDCQDHPENEIKYEAVDRYATNAHPLFVNCESFGSVTCYLSPDSDNYENRVTLYEAAATDVPGFRDSKWSLEEAMVALRSKFQHTDDVDYILGLIGRMDVNQQISSEDNGVTQTVQVRSGVSFVENQQVRPIVSLAQIGRAHV